jgi:hypothetical protein
MVAAQYGDLGQYYGNEGAADPVLIVLEPGAYVPLFRHRGEAGASGIALPASRHSVAVLPFASLSEIAEHEFFGEGVAEEIINRLVPNGEQTVGSRRIDPVQSLNETCVDGGDGVFIVLRTPTKLPFPAADGPRTDADARNVQVAVSKLS